ncbi:MAG: MFS transporter [Bacteroidales bacterium]|nr:MFS transporter [Bacteroidales bacterium]
MANKKSPWYWIPSLYFGQGIPYVVVATTVSAILYKQLGLSNADITLYTGWLYLPWVIKPFWSPFVDMFKTKRWWTVTMQFIMGVALAGVAFCIPAPYFLQSTLAIFWLLAFSSATHDIAADGFYMLALDSHQQSFFVGIRSTFYRIALVMGQGALVMVAGRLEKLMPSIAQAWSYTFYGVAVLFVLIAVYHYFVLPRPAVDQPNPNKNIALGFFSTFGDFFKKRGIILALSFILLYRLAEAQLIKIAPLFLLSDRAEGGLGMETESVGFVYGTVGIIALTLGGISGGIVASRDGLKKWLWPMVLALNVTNLIYVYFAYAQPQNFFAICSGVAVEQFGYGFGFTAFMLYLIYISRGKLQTAHYAICTGFMALGMMVPGMFAGKIQEFIGYQHFFLWVCLCTIPGFILVALLKIDPTFGKKSESKTN